MNGHSERFDIITNKWSLITPHPEPALLIQARGLNVFDKFLYIFSVGAGRSLNENYYRAVMLWILDF
jgi:hypothetical protein